MNTPSPQPLSLTSNVSSENVRWRGAIYLILLVTLFQPTYIFAEEKAIGGDFTLTDHNGKRFDLSAQRGQVVVLFFGFTHCPAICPDSLAKMALTLNNLGDIGKRVQAAFISVDPERDTVARLADYVPFFSPEILGLTGDAETIAKIAQHYKVQYQLNKKNADDKLYTVDHSPDLYVLDTAGKLDSIIPYGMPVQHIEQVLKGVLANADKQEQEKNQTTAAKATDKDDSAKPNPYQNLAGEAQHLKDHLDTPLLINFWASWCGPCRAEIPALNRAWKSLQDEELQMLAINVGETEEAVQAFLEDYPIDFPVWLDEQGTSFARWNIKGMPKTIILNRDGEVMKSITGIREWDSLEMLGEIRRTLDFIN